CARAAEQDPDLGGRRIGHRPRSRRGNPHQVGGATEVRETMLAAVAGAVEDLPAKSVADVRGAILGADRRETGEGVRGDSRIATAGVGEGVAEETSSESAQTYRISMIVKDLRRSNPLGHYSRPGFLLNFRFMD